MSEKVASIEDGVAQIAFDLGGSEAGYLIIQTPNDAGAKDEFFGHDHYVEIKDQPFGRCGRPAALKVSKDNEVEVGLTYDVPGIGNQLTIVASASMPATLLSQLGLLERG